MESAPSAPYHHPALVPAVLEYLAPHPGAVIVDGTCGTGGHSLAILPHLLPNGRLIAMDQDEEALALAQQRLAEFAPQITFHRGNFRHLLDVLAQCRLQHADGVLLDVGMSSLHVDRPERGFSFLREGPLDMRMDMRQPRTAADVVRTASESELIELISTLGEDRFARRIARRIVMERRQHPLDTTTQLAQLIERAVPPGARGGRLHPATRTFQALRMAVNDELGALEDVLAALPALLAPTGRAVILTFHSLEDRLVEQAFVRGEQEGIWVRLTKKPIRPSTTDVAENSRIRSVKLRAVEKR